MCGRRITIGVSHRVEELADRPEGYVRQDAKAFESLVPLPEVIAASMGCSPVSKKAEKEYVHMLSELGAEFEILRMLPTEDIRRCVRYKNRRRDPEASGRTGGAHSGI